MYNINILKNTLLQSSWLKDNGEEEIIFLNHSKIYYKNNISGKSKIDEYYLLSRNKALIKWSEDNYISEICFNEKLNSFSENGITWNRRDTEQMKNFVVKKDLLTHADYLSIIAIVKPTIEELIVKESTRSKNDHSLRHKIDFNYELLSKLILLRNSSVGEYSYVGSVGFVIVRYWSNEEGRVTFTLNNDQNELVSNVSEFNVGSKYLVKSKFGLNLRMDLPDKDNYSKEEINNIKLVSNLPQFTYLILLDKVYQLSKSDYWARVKIIK